MSFMSRNPSGIFFWIHSRKNDAPCRLEARFARNKKKLRRKHMARTTRRTKTKEEQQMMAREGTTRRIYMDARKISVRLVPVQDSFDLYIN